MKHLPQFFLILFFMVYAPAAAAEDCQQADALARQAYDLGDAPGQYAQQTRLLEEALRLCPHHAEAHNNLGWLAEQQGQFEAARKHYQQAVAANADLVNAWSGLGRMYEREQQFPLALEAYLRVCRQKPEARERIKTLLEDNRYQTAPDGAIFNKDSLLLLFDRERREHLNTMLEQCRFRSGEDVVMRGINVEAAVDFPNILFELGQATLDPHSAAQIRAIAEGLAALPQAIVLVNGHTDTTPFVGVTDPQENRRLNLRLSQERAETVKQTLAQLGVAAERIETQGYGFDRPAVEGDAPDARARNRRVEIILR